MRGSCRWTAAHVDELACCKMPAGATAASPLLLLTMCAALLCLHASDYCFAAGMGFAGGLVIVFNKQQAYLLGALLVPCRAESDCLYYRCPALHRTFNNMSTTSGDELHDSIRKERVCRVAVVHPRC
jgi:hypothetical protein